MTNMIIGSRTEAQQKNRENLNGGSSSQLVTCTDVVFLLLLMSYNSYFMSCKSTRDFIFIYK